MDFNLQTLNFNATEKLNEYIQKKVAKLEKNPDIQAVFLDLKVIKPESANNKEAKITIKMPGRSIHGEKVADTVEEAINHCIDIARRALEKTK